MSDVTDKYLPAFNIPREEDSFSSFFVSATENICQTDNPEISQRYTFDVLLGTILLQDYLIKNKNLSLVLSWLASRRDISDVIKRGLADLLLPLKDFLDSEENPVLKKVVKE